MRGNRGLTRSSGEWARKSHGQGLDSHVMCVLKVCETFTSIQGESSYAGASCFFIRLAGCNLRCTYCDTERACAEGLEVPLDGLLAEASAAPVDLIEITGGEPLLQEGFKPLATALRDRAGKRVLVETNGSRDLRDVPDGVTAIVDVKCPGSGEVTSFLAGNVESLRSYDEVKFVLTDRADFDWAADFVRRHRLPSRCAHVFFSPAWGRLPARDLGEWLLGNALGVRLQVQLHKVLEME